MSAKINDTLRQRGGLHSMDDKYQSGQLRDIYSEITRNALEDTGK